MIYLQILKFTDFHILLAMYLNFNSLQGVVWDNNMKKTFSHFQNYIPIPFSVLWDRRAGTMPGRLLQKITTTIPQCAQTMVSRLASCPTRHSALGKKHLPLQYLRWSKTGVLLRALYYLHFLVQKRKKFFMPAWIEQLFSPFLLLHKSQSKMYFCCESFKDTKVPWFA